MSNLFAIQPNAADNFLGWKGDLRESVEVLYMRSVYRLHTSN